MMPEKLMDAMNLLPDDLLEETNTLRQRKRIPWKPLTALAACLCLVAGLWFVFPGAKSADNAFGGVAENGTVQEDVEDDAESAVDGAGLVTDQQQSSSSCMSENVISEFTVVEVYEDHITACLGSGENIAGIISFRNLEKVPKLRSGQYIRVWWEPESAELGDSFEMAPYKIEVPEEEQMKKLLIGVGVAVLLVAVCVAVWRINKRIHPNCDCWGPSICDCGPTVVIDEDENTQEQKTE